MLLKSSCGGFVIFDERGKKKKKRNPQKTREETRFRRYLATDGVMEFNTRKLLRVARSASERAEPAFEIKTHISFLYTVLNPIMIPCYKRQ